LSKNNLFQLAAGSNAEQWEETLMQGNENNFTMVSEIGNRIASLPFPVYPDIICPWAKY